MAKKRTSKVRLTSVLTIMFFIISIISPITGITAVAASGGELQNVALYKPVTSSDGVDGAPESLTGHEPFKIVDGDIYSGWSAESGVATNPKAVKAWIQIDLEKEHQLKRIEVVDRQGFPDQTGARKHFQIQASNDVSFSEGQYVVLGEVGAQPFEDDGTWVLEVTDETPYRYVRFQKTLKEYAYIAEIRVFGIPVEEPEEPYDPGDVSEFYVSPDGNDNNDGSIDKPFATIEKARDVIRGINSNMQGDIIVYLRGGEYKISNTIIFDQRDSGTNGYRIIYTNYPGETPVFTGAQDITGWIEENGIFKTNVGTLKFRDLYINDQRGMRARTNSYKIRSWNAGAKTFNIDSSAFEGWDNINVSKVEAVLNTHWVESYTRMQSYQVNGDQAAVRLTSFGDIIFTREHPDRAVNQSVHFENAYEFMDKPGEWYLNEDNGDLFYIPREGETLENLDAKIGTVETFIKIAGSMSTTVQNIVIRGITFEYTTFNYPIQNNGVIFSQAGFVRTNDEVLGALRQPAALYLECAENIIIERNTFKHLGATGIDIKYAAQNNRIIGNALLDIAGNGIIEGIFSDSAPGFSQSNARSHAKNNRIANNYLRGISADYYCGTGIVTGYTNGTVIEHNEISDVGYSAIAVGWGWTANTTCLGNTKVNYNNIYDFVNRQSDGAGIYTLSKTPNAEIAGNYIHDSDRNEFASNYPLTSIYLDQNSSGFNVHDNVMTRVDVKVHLNMVDASLNTFANNDSQDETIIQNAGLEPEYWDIVPETIRQSNGNDWTAPTYGGVRISGEVTADDNVRATICKNGTELWSAELEKGETESYLLNIDVLPGDKISFEGEGASWDSMLKPEVYVPRLIIAEFSHPDQVDAAEISDRYKTVILKVKPGTDIKNFTPTIMTPPGTVLDPESAAITDYSSDVTLRVYMEEGSEFLGFAGERKYKDWKVKVLVDSEAVFVKGFNIGQAIDDVDNWHASGSSKTAGVNSLRFGAGGYSLYRARQYSDELLEFYMNVKATGGDWPAIILRSQSDMTDPLGNNNSCYIVCIKEEVIELQRFNRGVRTVFYGNIGGTPSLVGDAIPNAFFEHGQDNLIQIGAMNTDEGVRLVMYINGKKAFDVVDRESGRLENPGYFGTYQASNVMTLKKAPEIVSLNDAIADANSWYMSAGRAVAGTNSLTFENGGYSIYRGKEFQDGLFEFTMNTNAASGDWPSITFRNQSNSANPIGAGGECYIVVVKKDVIELQRFNNGQRTVFYGNVGGSPSLIGDAIPNTFFTHGENNTVHLGAINTDNGVRLIMYVDGKKVFDCVDTADDRIEDAGYFGTYQAAGPIKLSKTPKSTNLADAIADAENWYMSKGTATAGTNSLTLEKGGYSIYKGKQFRDELLEFTMNTDITGGAWQSITFRNQSDTANPIDAGGECYIVVIKESVIELQRFNDGNRTVFYGNIAENPGLIGDGIPNTFFESEKDNLVQVGAMNTDEGVRLVMYVNGKEVFDCIDEWDGKIESAGYFGTYQAANPIKLSKNFDITSEGDIFGLLDFEIQKVEDTLETAPIGDKDSEYALWAKEYLQLVLADVQEFRNNADESTSKEEVDAALRMLKDAQSVFQKSKVQTMVNIALGKTVTSSDGDNIYLGHDPSKLVDGTVGPNNGWSPTSYESTLAWAQIDLGAVSEIKRIEMVPRPGTDANALWEGPRKNFEIRASNVEDFSEYVVLGSQGSQAFPDNTTWSVDLPDGTKYRYVRYQKTDNLYFYVSEIRVLGIVAPETYTVGGVVTDESGQPVEGAIVNIYSFDDQSAPLGTAITAADGSYTIDTEQFAGKYTVRAVKEGSGIGNVVIYVPFASVNNADIVMTAGGEAFTIGTPVFKNAAGEELEHLVPSADLKATVSITNNLEEPGSACFIIALYGPDNTFKNIAYVESVLDPFETLTFNAGFKLPDDVTGYRVKVFVWDSIDGMKPLSDVVEFQ